MTEKKETNEVYNYKDKTAPKLSQEFQEKFTVDIKGKKAIKVDGLVALAHTKGLKSMVTKVVQFPTNENGHMCIASTHIVGYDWNPVEEKVCEVEYEDFGDACPDNCGKMTAEAYIRMASTRSVGRVLRKYTNIDMVTSEELKDVVNESEPSITEDQLAAIKSVLKEKGLTPDYFKKVLKDVCNFDDITHCERLTAKQGDSVLSVLNAL